MFDADPVRRARLLAAHGVDATAAASTLAAITRMPGDSGKASAQPLTGWLYLPQPEWLSDADCVRIASALQAARRMDHLR